MIDAVKQAVPGRQALVALVAALAAIAAACASDDTTVGSSSETPPTTEATTSDLPPITPGELPAPTELASGLHMPWGLAFLPDGDALVSERDSGRLLRLSPAGELTELGTIPEVEPGIEGGLLGIAVAPSFAEDRFVYAYLTTEEDNRIVRFPIDDLDDVDVLLDGIDSGPIHDGGRLQFGPDGHLYATVGDAAVPENAQDLDSLNGKVLRLLPNGGVPDDNPFPGSPVYTWGHRNIQGLAWDEEGRLWASELGQNDWDELNLLVPGANYGWPEVEGMGTDDGKYTNPEVVWLTAEASPSGVAFWRDVLHIGAMRGQRIWQVAVTGAGAGDYSWALEYEYGRIRTLTVAPDGSLWATTSNTDTRGEPRPGDDRVLRFPPT